MLSPRVRAALAAVACLVTVGLPVPTAQASTSLLVPVPYPGLPQSFDELPLGPATTLPWWQDGVLHVGDTTIATEFTRLDSRDGTTVIGRGRGLHHSGGQWYLVVGDHLERLPTHGTTDLPLISANGRWIAWLDEHATAITSYKDDTRYKAVIYDARERAVVDVFRSRRKVAWEDGINGIWLHSIDNTGRLFFTLGHDGLRIWRPGRGPIPVTGIDDDLGQNVDGWPRGVAARVPHSWSGKAMYGRVAGTGEFTEVGRVPDGYSGVWSMKGAAFARRHEGASDTSTFWVDRIDDGTSVQLGLPEAAPSPNVVGWESETEVILWLHGRFGDERRSLLLRCDTTTGDCERVQGGPAPWPHATMQGR